MCSKTCNLHHVHFATRAFSYTCNLQHMHFITCTLCNMYTFQHVHFATHALWNTFTLQHVHFATCALYILQFAKSKQDKSARWISLTDRPVRQTSSTNQLDGPAGGTSWTSQLDGPAGQTSWTDQFSLFENDKWLRMRFPLTTLVMKSNVIYISYLQNWSIISNKIF